MSFTEAWEYPEILVRELGLLDPDDTAGDVSGPLARSDG